MARGPSWQQWQGCEHDEPPHQKGAHRGAARRGPAPSATPSMQLASAHTAFHCRACSQHPSLHRRVTRGTHLEGLVDTGHNLGHGVGRVQRLVGVRLVGRVGVGGHLRRRMFVGRGRGRGQAHARHVRREQKGTAGWVSWAGSARTSAGGGGGNGCRACSGKPRLGCGVGRASARRAAAAGLPALASHPCAAWRTWPSALCRPLHPSHKLPPLGRPPYLPAAQVDGLETPSHHLHGLATCSSRARSRTKATTRTQSKGSAR